MRCKRIVILSFIALGFAIQGPSAMAQLPVAGALVHLDAALGVNTDFSGNLTLWENQGTGDPYLTDFVPDGGNIGTLPVTPSAFPKGTPGVYFNAARINSQGDWFDPDTGYTIFFVTDSVSDGFSPGGPPGSSGGALLQADCPSCPPQSYSNKVGFDNYLTKPIQVAELLSRIEAALNEGISRKSSGKGSKHSRRSAATGQVNNQFLVSTR